MKPQIIATVEPGEIPGEEPVYSCMDCGGFGSAAEKVQHHPTCEPGSAAKWEKFYEDANAEEALDLNEEEIPS